MNKFDLITILGPTATGKTRFAVRLARQLNGEIISADSRQVYRNMDIGTGKDIDEYNFNGEEIPYHLVDIVNPGSEYNVYSFQNDFLKAFQEIDLRKKQTIMCGGTGMYIESVLLGYRMKKVPENKNLRISLSEKTLKELTEILKSYGPIHNVTDISDKKRCVRAIEIKKYDLEHPDEEKFPQLSSLNIGIKLERQELKKRITLRLKERLENGLIEEVKNLLNNGLQSQQLLFYGLEYRFVTQYVTGEIDYSTMFEKLNIAIHQFSKRQMTWFRRMEKKGIKIHWLDGNLSDDEKVIKCLSIIEKNK